MGCLPVQPGSINKILYSTAQNAVMARLAQAEQSMEQMNRLIEEMRIENRRAICIGEEMDQEIEG